MTAEFDVFASTSIPAVLLFVAPSVSDSFVALRLPSHVGDVLRTMATARASGVSFLAPSVSEWENRRVGA